MEEKIIEILKGFIKIESFTDSSSEEAACDYIYSYMRKLPYFKAHPDQVGKYAIPGDVHGRSVFYALVLGPSKRTFVSMGHFDVVGIEEYGGLKQLAFESESLAGMIGTRNISREAREDLASGEWIFGRGTADMKGGLSMHMALMEEYAAEEEKRGSMLLIGVPDEESYSCGMRAANKLLVDLKERYGLDYRLLVDPEPNMITNGKQVVSTGSVGKCMPVVMVQGVKAHVGRCFEGLNPLSILMEIYRETEMSLRFTDTYKGETTLPPVWTFLKDLKREYDVSLPYRACGYFTVLSLEKTPEDVMELLETIAAEAFQRVVENLDKIYQEFRNMSRFTELEEISYKPQVLTFAKLMERLKKEKGYDFQSFYQELYGKITGKIAAGRLNYPEATIELMEAVLAWSDIQEPLVLLGFTPPYYPAISSDNLKGREGAAEKVFSFLTSSGAKHGVSFEREYYFTGISDLSYCGIDKPFDYQSYSKNTPMWGELYQIDFASMEKAPVPAIILGPWGKDLHKMTERVHRESLAGTIPKITKELREFVWKE